VRQEGLLYHRETRTQLDSILRVVLEDRPLLINVSNIKSIVNLFLHDNFVCVIPNSLRFKHSVMWGKKRKFQIRQMI